MNIVTFFYCPDRQFQADRQTLRNNNLFSHSEPSCEAPEPPANGNIEYNELTLYSTASLECNTGYRLPDDEPSTITCHMPDGTFTPTWGIIPACEGTVFSFHPLITEDRRQKKIRHKEIKYCLVLAHRTEYQKYIFFSRQCSGEK